MKRRIVLSFSWFMFIGICGVGAERSWQTGTWADVRTTRPKVVFGLQPSPNRPGPHTPTPTLQRVYAIESDVWRFELAEIPPVSTRTVDAVVGEAVTFAVDKNTLYVRDRNGLEYRLRITKKLAPKRFQ